MAENKKSALGWGLGRTPQRGRGKENHAPDTRTRSIKMTNNELLKVKMF